MNRPHVLFVEILLTPPVNDLKNRTFLLINYRRRKAPSTKKNIHTHIKRSFKVITILLHSYIPAQKKKKLLFNRTKFTKLINKRYKKKIKKIFSQYLTHNIRLLHVQPPYESFLICKSNNLNELQNF